MKNIKKSLLLTTAMAFSATPGLMAFEGDVEHDWSRHARTSVLAASHLKEVDDFLAKAPTKQVELELVEQQKKLTQPLSEKLDVEVRPTISVAAPIVTENEDGTVNISKDFQAQQDLLLEMNDISYLMVKGDKRSIEKMKKLQDEGYIVKAFGGLEGRRNTFGDMSGLIFVKQDTGKVYVVVHGTATVDGVEIDGVDYGRMAGWETNFDGRRQKAFHLEKEYGKDLFEQVRQDLKKGKIHVRPGTYKTLKAMLDKHLYDETTGYKEVQDVHKAFKEAIDSEKMNLKTGRKIMNAFFTKMRLMEHIENEDVKLPGQVHNGFAKKYISFREDMLAGLRNIAENMDIQELFVTGHSMGGGISPMVLYDIKANYGEEIFGKNNHKGIAKGYFLSAARAGDKTFAKAIEESVGKENMIRHNVYGDPVPIASGDKVMKELIEKIPAIGELLGQAAGFYDFGYLVKDDAEEAWQRAREAYKDNADFAQYVDPADELAEAVSTVYGWSGQKGELPNYISGKQPQITWYRNPIQWTQRANRVVKLARLIKKTIDGDEKAKEQLVNTLTVRYAHLHFGYSRTKDTGAVFNPLVVGRDLNRMANDGKVHEDARIKALKETKA